nr:aldose reductase-like [Leptinotarsa decemlineata]
MASKVPSVMFNDGHTSPIFGLGTWLAEPEEVTQAVEFAIDVGYRHFDCAPVYGNEAEVGKALKAKIKDGTVKREDLFITSKLWNTFHLPCMIESALRTTLNDLGLEYLDLYLVHWPFALKEGGELFPTHPNGTTAYSDVHYLDTWLGMERVQRKGLTRSIGLSNFNKKQTDRILQHCTIKPVTNQIEVQPYLNQKRFIEYLKSKDIVVTAYSPLGSPDRPWAKPEDPKLLEDPRLKVVAEKNNRSPAQVLLRYEVQRGCITIPKSIDPWRIQHNFQIWDFNLDPEDMAAIDSMDCNFRFCPYADAFTHKYHPFVNSEY